MKSVGAMVKQLAGLSGADGVTEWENSFITNIVTRTNVGQHTQALSEKQVEVVERIYKKHFGDAS